MDMEKKLIISAMQGLPLVLYTFVTCRVTLFHLTVGDTTRGLQIQQTNNLPLHKTQL